VWEEDTAFCVERQREFVFARYSRSIVQKYTGRRLQEQAPSTARTERAFAAPAEKEDATPLLTPVEPAHATLAAPAEKQDATPMFPLLKLFLDFFLKKSKKK
jgi:hypothetical protein